MPKKKIEEKRQYFTTEQIAHANEVVKNRIHEVVRTLGKSANLISYMCNPHRTAIGAAYSYNEENISNEIWNNITSREGLEYDGNAGYTLIQLAEMIEKGEI